MEGICVSEDHMEGNFTPRNILFGLHMNKKYAKAKGNFSNPQAKDVISVYSTMFKYVQIYFKNFV